MAVAPSNFASAVSNTVAVTINLGDLVFVWVCNADGTAPVGITDSIGNIYGLLFTDNSNSQYSALYVCLPAKAATSASFTAGHSPSIAVATFTGATGVGLVSSNNSGSGGGGISQAITTRVANSYIAAFASFFKSATVLTIAGATGTLQTSIASTVALEGMAAITLAAATPGSFTPAATLSAGSSKYVFVAIEVWSAGYGNYEGKCPPKQEVVAKFKQVQIYGGSGGGPVTPVPIGAVLHDGTTGVAYSETITAQGGTGTGYTYAVTGGAVPAGTSLVGSTGIISGTPTTVASYSFTITVTDSLGNFGSQSFTINVAAPSGGGGGSFTFLN